MRDRKFVDPVARGIVKMMPRRLLYWATMRVGTSMKLFRPHEEVPEVPFTVILARLHGERTD